MEPRSYRVNARDREPLLSFILDALRAAHCRIVYASPPNQAPFRITFESPFGERLGIIAYAFLANSRRTRNRPTDEHRFQVKYGSKDFRLHQLYQDPFGLYTTLFLGISPDRGIFVAADPVLHSPTRFFISIEFKEPQVNLIERTGWHVWERDRRSQEDEPIEVLVGGTRDSFLRYVRFERDALGEDQGHRQLLAERAVRPTDYSPKSSQGSNVVLPWASRTLHSLAQEFSLSEHEVLDLIAGARRLKMAVRGWVAEHHLVNHLQRVPGVTDCRALDIEGSPDVELRFEGSRPLRIECKNVLRMRTARGDIRLDFQRTRASKKNPCSRYYGPGDFDIVAACLHAVTEDWRFRYARPVALDAHPHCRGKLSSNVRLDSRWHEEAMGVLRAAASAVA